MCGYPQNTENFLLYRWEDEFYIIHRDSGTIINYVRSRYPEIEKTFDFAAYSAGVALKEFGRCIKEAFGGTDKEVDDVCDSEH